MVSKGVGAYQSNGYGQDNGTTDYYYGANNWGNFKYHMPILIATDLENNAILEKWNMVF